MKQIYVNLKRFDVSEAYGGVNRISPINGWAEKIMNDISKEVLLYKDKVELIFFFPEAHIINAVKYKPDNIKIGCQGVYRDDLSIGGNFGAFTTNRPASAVKELGCEYVLIGHCEQRRDIAEIISQSGGDLSYISKILNREVHSALNRKLGVLYCVGETADEQHKWQDVLKEQLKSGLMGIEHNVAIAYEPVWAIGPGKTPPDSNYIRKVAQYIKELTGGLPVIYGGGLKQENAKMLASISEIDGGLIALTRFSGNIGFYPDEYISILKEYIGC